MDRPKKLSGEQGAYIEFLEKKLEIYSARKTSVRAYITFSKVINDITDLVNKGMYVDDPNDPEGDKIRVELISEEALMSKDEKTFDRIKGFLDKLPTYINEISALEEKFSEEEINTEKSLMKGTASVEAYLTNRRGE